MDDCIIHGLDYGIRGYGDRLTVTRCNIYGMKYAGIKASGNNGAPKASFLIQYNWCHDWEVYNSGGFGIQIEYDHRVGEVSYNYVAGMRVGIGYYYGGPRTGLGQVVIRNNTIDYKFVQEVLLPTKKERTANVATLTVGSHSLAVGKRVTVALTPADTNFDGEQIVTATTPSTISFAKTGTDIPITDTGGMIHLYVRNTMGISLWGADTNAGAIIIKDNLFVNNRWYSIYQEGGTLVGAIQVDNNFFYNNNWFYWPGNQYTYQWFGNDGRSQIGWGPEGPSTGFNITSTNLSAMNPILAYTGSTADSWYKVMPGSPARGASSDGTEIGAWQMPQKPHIYVDPINGNDTSDGDLPTTPVKTLRRALILTTSGGTIHAAEGTYTSATLSKPVKLIGRNRLQTIITGSGLSPAFLVTASGVTIEGFCIQNSTVGVEVSGGQSQILGNWFRNNTIGVDIHSTSTVVVGNNNLENQTTDILVEDNAGLSRANYNNFDGLGIGVQNNDAATFNARSNWWGVVSGPTPPGLGDQVIGNVDASPYQSSELPLIDRDGDSLPDSVEDVDGDGVVDPGETNPLVNDTDGDGVEDGVEITLGTDPLNPADIPSSPPGHFDSDLDGYRDFYEVAEGTDPFDSSDYPKLGDVNNDGVANNLDAIIILNIFLGNLSMDGYLSDRMDINRDGLIDNVDAVVLYNYSLGYVTWLPFP